MNIHPPYSEIATCHNCDAILHYTYGQNVYSGGPWYCSGCKANVTYDVYGLPKMDADRKLIKLAQYISYSIEKQHFIGFSEWLKKDFYNQF